jgi:NhaA family Na+:H+ antiporter
LTIQKTTDIALSLGILALLGRRISTPAKVFLTALAIVDDIGASLVIALFYTEEISWWALAVGGVFWAGQIAMNIGGVRRPSVYAVLGLGLWMAFLKSGVHPTLAGILGAMAIPVYTRINTEEFLDYGRKYLEQFSQAGEPGTDILTNVGQNEALEAMEIAAERAQSPLQRLDHAMRPWVIFGVMPLFALANAGVSLGGNVVDDLRNSVALGIIAGLVVGKQVGITGMSWLAVRAGWARLPVATTWRQLYGISWLGGIGFTMSLFIASLAFRNGELLPAAKAGILAASILAGTGGYCILRFGAPPLAPADRKGAAGVAQPEASRREG